MSEPRPTIVCLCGSTRFYEAFQRANYDETMAGRIVLTVGFYLHSPHVRHEASYMATPADKVRLDELHKRKIDLADEILVLNVDGYIGESTSSEIDYAEAHGKRVRYLQSCTCGPDLTGEAPNERPDCPVHGVGRVFIPTPGEAPF